MTNMVYVYHILGAFVALALYRMVSGAGWRMALKDVGNLVVWSIGLTWVMFFLFAGTVGLGYIGGYVGYRMALSGSSSWVWMGLLWWYAITVLVMTFCFLAVLVKKHMVFRYSEREQEFVGRESAFIKSHLGVGRVKRLLGLGRKA